MTQQQADAPATTYPVAELERRFYAFAIDRLVTWGLYVAVGVVAWLLLGNDPLAVAGIAAWWRDRALPRRRSELAL